MREKAEIGINIAVIFLTLILTIVYAVDGNTLVSVIFGAIMLLNCVTLFLRVKKLNGR